MFPTLPWELWEKIFQKMDFDTLKTFEKINEDSKFLCESYLNRNSISEIVFTSYMQYFVMFNGDIINVEEIQKGTTREAKKILNSVLSTNYMTLKGYPDFVIDLREVKEFLNEYCPNLRQVETLRVIYTPMDNHFISLLDFLNVDNLTVQGWMQRREHSLNNRMFHKVAGNIYIEADYEEKRIGLDLYRREVTQFFHWSIGTPSLYTSDNQPRKVFNLKNVLGSFSPKSVFEHIQKAIANRWDVQWNFGYIPTDCQMLADLLALNSDIKMKISPKFEVRPFWLFHHKLATKFATFEFSITKRLANRKKEMNTEDNESIKPATIRKRRIISTRRVTKRKNKNKCGK